jgi:hypothetical protein
MTIPFVVDAVGWGWVLPNVIAVTPAGCPKIARSYPLIAGRAHRGDHRIATLRRRHLASDPTPRAQEQGDSP